MKPKQFKTPLDQGFDKFESTVVAFAAGFASMGVFYLCLNALISLGGPGEWGAAGSLFVFPALIAGLLGGVSYRETVYRVGRNGWRPRLLLDGVVLLAFYLVSNVHSFL